MGKKALCGCSFQLCDNKPAIYSNKLTAEAVLVCHQRVDTGHCQASLSNILLGVLIHFLFQGNDNEQYIIEFLIYWIRTRWNHSAFFHTFCFTSFTLFNRRFKGVAPVLGVTVFRCQIVTSRELNSLWSQDIFTSN